jgi:hypothetical protein
MPQGATPGRNLGKEVTQGYAVPGGGHCAPWTRRILSEPNWGNTLADRRETAGREPLYARSPVVGAGADTKAADLTHRGLGATPAASGSRCAAADRGLTPCDNQPPSSMGHWVRPRRDSPAYRIRATCGWG